MTKYYGYTLSKEFANKNKSNYIYIMQIEEIFLKDFPICHQFHNNQNRQIRLYTKDNLTKTNNHTKWLFEVDGVVTFLCDHEKECIYYKKEKEFSQKLCEYWLNHIVLAIYFTMNGKYYFFHAGAVMIDDVCVAFTGDSHTGKSTLTDFFIKKGHAMITDDKLPTFQEKEKFYTIGSHPFHRPYRANEELGYRVEKFVEDSLPLSHIYILCPVAQDENVGIEECKAIEKFQELLYASEVKLPIFKKQRFEYLASLANNVGVFYLYVPRSIARLDEVYEKIIQHTNKQNLKRNRDVNT